MGIALAQSGLRAERQIPLKVVFRGAVVGDFRADMLVENSVLLELKAVRQLDPSHEAQLLNYLRATEIEVGCYPISARSLNTSGSLLTIPGKQICVYPCESAAG
jgi:hypothetical protein